MNSFGTDAGFGDFGSDGFGAEGGFGGGIGEPVVNTSAPQVNTGAKLDGIPLSQIKGLQNAQYDSLESAEEALHSISRDELLRRRECSEAFQWVHTIVDKANWHTNDKGNRVRKQSKFLGWGVITADSAGAVIPVTNSQLLAYIAANGTPDGVIGSGATGLRLNKSIREKANPKAGDFTRTAVLSLTALDNKVVSKFSEEKVVEAKEPIWEDEAKTIPKMRLKPGKKKDSPRTDEYYTQVWDFKEEYAMFVPARGGGRKKAKKSEDAFKMLVLMMGLNQPEALF